ncbi:hypothetical protein JCM3765_006996 [Sporobolomyces pararoseus]
MADYLLDLLDLGSPYLPRAITTPLYTLIEQLPSSPSELFQNPTSSLLPLILTLFSCYLAFNQFFSTLRWGFKTSLLVIKLGLIGTILGTIWKGYESFGTEKGVSGGLRDVYLTVEKFGRGVYQVGKTGSGWYNSLGGVGSGVGGRDTRAGSRTRRSKQKSTNYKKRMWEEEDPEEIDLGKQNTEEFVKNAMEKARGIWGIFNSDSKTSTGRGTNTRRQKKNTESEGGGFVWNLLANQAKKVWEDAVDGMEQPGAKTTRKRTTRR